MDVTTIVSTSILGVLGSAFGWLILRRIDRLEAVMVTRDEMDARFDAVDARFDAVDARFDAVDRRFDAVDARFEAMERRLGRVEDRSDSVRSDLTQIALAVGARARPQAR